MGGEFSFDDYLMERDVFEDFTPSEVDAIHAAMRREEAEDKQNGK